MVLLSPSRKIPATPISHDQLAAVSLQFVNSATQNPRQAGDNDHTDRQTDRQTALFARMVVVFLSGNRGSLILW